MFKLCVFLLVIATHLNEVEGKIPEEYDYFNTLFDDVTTDKKTESTEGKRYKIIYFKHNYYLQM